MSALTEQLKQFAQDASADLVGVAAPDCFDGFPVSDNPLPIFPR